ncbi:SRPBCC domain-containing protein [Pleomorphomonas sp. PLEO]|uniref:SRPBCC family protein n=1 Tax=Pleomorphomonas sp. PLEO TaxID=3239306 RepID=UPI00351F119F
MKATELFTSRIVKAGRERVFAAWTLPELVKQWWGPPPYTCPHAEIDLRVGGAYRLANLGPDGETIWISGVFIRVEAPAALSYTWKLSTQPTEPSLVHVSFVDHPEGTEVRIHHERFADPAVRDEHAEGWQGCLGKFSAFVLG